MKTSFSSAFALLAAIGLFAQQPSIFPAELNTPQTRHNGEIWLSFLAESNDTFPYNLTVANSAPGTRLDWHSHPEGQRLVVTEGTGYYQERGRLARIMRPGMVFECPPGVEHFHAASPEEGVVYLAIYPESQTQWGRPVTDAEYAAVPAQDSLARASDARAAAAPGKSDEQLILEALNAETAAAFRRDYAAWREHWVHAPYVFKVYMDLRDSTMSEDRGWAPVDDFVRTYIEEHPEPDPLPAPLTDAEVRVYGTGAYVEYEQLDPGRGRKREIRLMEKHGGRWRVAGMRTVIYGVGDD